MLKKTHRITSARLIRLLFKKGKVYKNKSFIIRFLPSLHEKNQFVVIVSKKVSKTAVKRNRIKRQVTELLRLKLEEFKSPTVASILIKQSAEPYAYHDFKEGIEEFVKILNNKQ